MATNQLNQKWGLMQGLLKLSNRFVFGYSLVAVAVATAWVLGVSEGEQDAKAKAFLWAFWFLPLIAFEAVRSGSLRGLRWIISAQFPEKIVRPIAMIALVGSTLLIGAELTVVTAMQFNLIGAFAAFIVGALLLAKAFPQQANVAKPEYTIKLWAVSFLPLSLIAGLKMLDSQVSILFLGFLGSTEDAGLFRVAATGAGLVGFGLTAVNMALAPQVARLYRAGELEKLQRIITLGTRAVAAISFPVAIVFIFWGKEVITLVFGAEYSNAAIALAILCVGQLVNASAGSVALILNMTGNTNKTIYGVLMALIINTLMALTLIPRFGLTGAALGYSVSMSVWNATLMYMAKKHVGINTFFLARL
jgi:O-antigen/teichoic acid export membrane protein